MLLIHIIAAVVKEVNTYKDDTIACLPSYPLITQKITDYYYYYYSSFRARYQRGISHRLGSNVPALLLSLITFFSSPSWHVAHL